MARPVGRGRGACAPKVEMLKSRPRSPPYPSYRSNPAAQAVDAVERIGRVAVDVGERNARHVGERMARTQIEEGLRAGFDEGLQRGGPVDRMGEPSRQSGGRRRCPEDAVAVAASKQNASRSRVGADGFVERAAEWRHRLPQARGMRSNADVEKGGPRRADGLSFMT